MLNTYEIRRADLEVLEVAGEGVTIRDGALCVLHAGQPIYALAAGQWLSCTTRLAPEADGQPAQREPRLLVNATDV